MAIMSAQQIFSEDQAITAAAASTNVLDLGAPGTPHGAAAALVRDIGKGCPIHLLAQVTEDFNNLTSLEIKIEVDDNEAFASPKTVATTGAIALADLVAGYQAPLSYVPQGTDEQYVRLYYTPTGTAPTTGKVTAGITMGNQTN